MDDFDRKIEFKALMEYGDQLDDESYRKKRPAKSKRTFHRFERLPRELQACVWRHYCPALADQPLILQFSYPSKGQPGITGVSLAGQTETVRAVLAVNRESRQLALRALPDVLDLHPNTMRSIVRFRRERDIVLLYKIMGILDWGPIPGFSDRIVNLAMDVTAVVMNFGIRDSVEYLSRFCLAFPNLKVLWSCVDYRGYDPFWSSYTCHSSEDKRLASDRWNRCHDQSSRMLTLDCVDGAFGGLEPNKVADAEVWLPDLENPLLHEEVNSLSARKAHPYLYMPGDEPAWTRLIPKGNAYEWFVCRAYKEEKDMPPGMFTDEELGRLKSIEMWPLVARHCGVRGPPRRKKKLPTVPNGRVPFSSLRTT